MSVVASAVDDAGRCGNVIARAVHGGCFVAGTLVTVSELPRDENFEHALWSQPAWAERADYLDLLCAEPLQAIAALANRPSHLVAIEQVPLGARVPTKNPKPWEYDDSLPEPDQDSWVKISLTVQRTDSGLVDAELLRPRQWADALGLAAGRLLPIDIQELQVQGTALIRAIEPCPLIAAGEGSPVTARFVTRQVDTIVRIEVLGVGDHIETIEGTTIHPIWSEDRQDWVPLGELVEGEQLCGATGPAIVLTATILTRSLPVYNIEVHGEHVYQVGTLGLLMHNACEGHHAIAKFLGGDTVQDLAKIPKLAHRELHSLLREGLKLKGFTLNVGGRGGAATDWARYMAANPGSQNRAFDAILDASRSIDAKWGTNTVQSFWTNLMSGSFTPFP